MGKISKLFNGELKKIFLGPGIFFMTAFLILVLTIAPKFFSPTSKDDLSTTTIISTTEVKDAYNSFLDNKTDFELKLTSINNDVNSLIDNNSNFKENLVVLAEELFELRTRFNGLTIGNDINAMLDCLNAMIDKASELQRTYTDYLKGYVFPVILVNEELDFNIDFEISQLIKMLSKEGNRTDVLYYKEMESSLYNSEIVTIIKNYISEIKNLTYSNDNLKNLLTDYYSAKDDYKKELNKSISEISTKAYADEEYNISKTNIDEMVNLAYKYLAVDNNSYNVIKNSLYLEISKEFSDAEMSGYVGFTNFNSYRLNEELTKYKYLLNNNLVDSEVANMFSFNTASSNNVNAFDYMFFTLEIASILIIAFTVILGAGMIAKEYSEGTIKLLVMRPFRRNKIIMAKILATMFLAFIFVIVSTIITLITGCIIYGISFPTMLVVFNSSVAFTLPIWLVFIIYLVCLMIKIWIFALLAIAISTIFKSYIAAVCISAGIYILNIVLTFVSNGANWLKYNIFANLDIFKYFGGSFISKAGNNQNLTSLFASPVFADTSVWLSIIIIVVLALFLHLILFTVFKHRDIT